MACYNNRDVTKNCCHDLVTKPYCAYYDADLDVTINHRSIGAIVIIRIGLSNLPRVDKLFFVWH